MMNSGRINLFGLLIIALAFHPPTIAQLVTEPVLGFERLSWGVHPVEVDQRLDIRWFSKASTENYRNFGSRRSDVFRTVGTWGLYEAEVLLLFEYSQSDSALVAVTLMASNLPGQSDLPSGFLDALWEEYEERFGEADGGKRIPFVGRSKEWNDAGVRIKMIRMSIPAAGIIVSYVLDQPAGNPRPTPD